MELWEAWRDMAQKSLQAAVALKKVDARSSVSRYYYAAYQAVTAILHYRGDLTPPEEREAWNHDQTPQMMQSHFKKFAVSNRRLNNAVADLAYLYQLRIYADYASVDFGVAKLMDARKSAQTIVEICQAVLPEQK